MNMVPGERMIEPARRWQAFVEGEANRLRRDMGAAKRDVAIFEQQRDVAWHALAAALLPAMDEAWFSTTAQRLKLPTIEPAHVRAEAAAEIARHNARIAEIDADPLYAQREQKLNELDIRDAEVNDAMKPLSESVDTLEAEPYFCEIVRAGYDTEHYRGRFWELSYYRHWKHGDLVMEKHGARYKATRFADLRTKYLEEQLALEQLGREKRRLADMRKQINALINERDDRAEAVRDAPQLTLKLARNRVRDHLSALSPDDVGAMISGYDEALVQLKRIVGLGKKIEYLNAMARRTLSPQIDQLDQARQKAARDVAKYQRKRYKMVPFVDVNSRLEQKRASYKKRASKWSDQRRQLVEWDDWDRGDWVSDFLWWDLFFDGRLDGDYIPEVAAYRSRHQDEAAAAVARVQRDRDEMLHMDAS